MDNDKMVIIIHTQQGVVSQTYYVTNLPAWYEFLGIFSLYAIVAMTIFYTGLWIVGKYK
tara:strand:+ start:331 stop:507 length:177 start_codon:yes stop_codon:yes gene_type:complete